MTINAPAALLLLLYELVAEQPGRPGRGAPRHGPERHPQGVHRPRKLHLPAAALDADHDRSLRVLPRADAALEHDLDLRLPHSRGRLDRGAGARVYPCERNRVLPGRRRSGPLARRVRRSALLLLQRAQPLLPGGGEVPCGQASVGADHARPLRRDQPARAGAPLSCADRRVDAHRPAAREQRRPGRGASALGGLRRRAVDPHELLTTRPSRSRPSAPRGSPFARSRSSRTKRGSRTPQTRSAARTSSRRSPASSRSARGTDLADRRAGRCGRGDRARLRAGRDRGGSIRARAQSRGRRAGGRWREPLSGGRGGARSSCTRSIPRPSGGRSSGRVRVRAERDAGAADAALAQVRETARGDGNLLTRCERRWLRTARSVRSAVSCVRSSARTTASAPRGADPCPRGSPD